MHKISSKWKNWTEQIPEFVFSKPGFPEVPPPLPYQIQFYYRAAFKEIRSFLHDRYILLCPLADKFQIEVSRCIYTLKPWHSLLIFPGELHRIEEDPDSVFSVLFASFHLRDDQNVMMPLRGRILNMDRIAKNLLFQAASAFMEHYPKQNCEDNAVSYRLGEFLERLRRNNMPMPESFRFANYVDDRSELLQRISQYIAENPNRKILIRELSRMLGVSASNLRRNFRIQTGTSLGSYLRSRRMLASVSLLRSSSQNIEQIAASCGYASLEAFSRAFKNEISSHCTPRQFRNQVRNRKP